MNAGAIVLVCLSGAAAVVNALASSVMWPVSAIACPPGHVVTVTKGCVDPDGPDGDAVESTAQLVAGACCVLSAGAVWYHLDWIAVLIFGCLCGLLSLGVGLYETTVNKASMSFV